MNFHSLKATAKKLALAGIAATALVASSATQAAAINAYLAPGINTFEDSDAERVLRRNGAGGFNVITSGNFQRGDIIQSVLRFETISNSTYPDTSTGDLPGFPPRRLSAFSELLVADIQGAFAGPGGVLFPNGAACAGADPACFLIFAPAGNLLPAGVMASLFEGPLATPTFFSQTPSAAITDVTTDTPLVSVGLNGIDDFWVASIPNVANPITTIAAATAGSGQAANGQFGLSVIANPAGIPVQTNGMKSGYTATFHDLVGDSSIYARKQGVNNGWLVSSNTNVSFNVVPEPGSLALMGGLILAGGFATKVARRRQKSA